MDHNYNDTPLLTNSDYESIMEDLKPDSFGSFGSPFRIDQNVTYEDAMINPSMRPMEQDTSLIQPPPPPLEQYGPVHVQDGTESVLVTAPPQLSPSLSPTGTIPSRDAYPGHFEFEIQLDSATASKKSWLYSMILNKVFIDMNKSLLIQFRVKDFMNGLFVRALPVYEQDDFVSVPVQRCGLHSLSDDPHGRAHPASEPGVCYCPRNSMVRHVVLCTHPQATYDYNNESDRHSVVVPLQPPQPGSDTTTLEYLFACKTSCPRGMNRKPIVVIFTLENDQCEVLGRLILPVKICSCPKRDKEKEEKEREEREKQGHDMRGKRRLSSHEKQELKRIKIENSAINGTQEPQADAMIKSETERINQMENKVDQILSQLENKIELKFNELNNKIDQKFSELDDMIKSFISSKMKY